MTNVKISRVAKRRYTLEIDGHAGFNPGNDIVCSAISMLAYSLAAALEETDKMAETDTREVTMESGRVRIDFVGRLPIVAKVLMQPIIGGFRLLAEEYPENVSLDLAV